MGSLLLINDANSTYQTGYDGNGNLISLVSSDGGTISALYDYDPFGNLLKSTGEYARKNPFKFSAKYTDEESGLVYYGYRYYNPETGRWITRDPIGESGGINLYLHTSNDPTNRYDAVGMQDRLTEGEVRKTLEEEGNFRWDWAGVRILTHWLNGSGEELDIDGDSIFSSAWKAYMTPLQ